MKKVTAWRPDRANSWVEFCSDGHWEAAGVSTTKSPKPRELYEGTRLGRQELQGAMILDPQNALFKDDWLSHDDVPEDLIEQVTVGVDPSGGNDEGWHSRIRVVE